MPHGDRAFKYNCAIVCRLPTSIVNLQPDISFETANREHKDYVQGLRKLGLDVIELPPDEKYPESVFVQDTAIVINGTALICRPSESSRAGEVALVRTVLKKELPRLTVIEVECKKAKLDGSDILWTGKEILVGISANGSNVFGASVVAEAFPEYATSIVNLPAGARHLTDYITVGGSGCLVVSQSDIGRLVYKQVKNVSSFSYSILGAMEDAAANVLHVNGTTAHLTRPEIPLSYTELDEKLPRKMDIRFSELYKAGGSLTNCCILIAYIRNPKNIVSAVTQQELSTTATLKSGKMPGF